MRYVVLVLALLGAIGTVTVPISDSMAGPGKDNGSGKGGGILTVYPADHL